LVEEGLRRASQAEEAVCAKALGRKEGEPSRGWCSWRPEGAGRKLTLSMESQAEVGLCETFKAVVRMWGCMLGGMGSALVALTAV
jgi:hypothetical protein